MRHITVVFNEILQIGGQGRSNMKSDIFDFVEKEDVPFAIERHTESCSAWMPDIRKGGRRLKTRITVVDFGFC